MPADSAATAERPQRQSSERERWSVAEVVWMMILPLLAFYTVHFTPIRQWSAIDPYVYMGYIHRFEDLIERFGLTYYSVRFGLILPSQVATVIFGADGGYFALRYLLVLLGGLPFYALVRQNHGRPVASASFAALVTSPFLARTILWEYVDASGVPLLLGAISLLLLEHRRRYTVDLAAGVLGGFALHSNVFVAAPLGLAILGLVAGHARTVRGIGAMAIRLAAFSVGIALVSAIGSIYYGVTVGHYDIFSVTLQTISNLNGQVARTAGITWMARQWAVIALPLFAVLAILTRHAGEPAYRRSVMWTGALTTGFFYAHQFLLNSNTLELTYYYSYALPAIFLCLALVLGRCRPDGDGPRGWWLMPAFLVPACVPWILWSFDLRLALPRSFTEYVLLAVAAAGIVCLASRRTGRWPWPVVGAAALGVLLFASFARPAYTRMIDSRAHPDRLEPDVHRAALTFMDFVPAVRERPGEIRFWYRNGDAGKSMRSLQSTYLYGFSMVQSFDTPGLPHLNDPEAARITAPGVRYLMLLAEDAAELPAARQALTSRGIRHAVVATRDIRSGSYQVHLELLDVQPH